MDGANTYTDARLIVLANVGTALADAIAARRLPVPLSLVFGDGKSGGLKFVSGRRIRWELRFFLSDRRRLQHL